MNEAMSSVCQASGRMGNSSLYQSTSRFVNPLANGGRHRASWTFDSDAEVPDNSDCKQNGTLICPLHADGASHAEVEAPLPQNQTSPIPISVPQPCSHKRSCRRFNRNTHTHFENGTLSRPTHTHTHLLLFVGSNTSDRLR